MNAPTEKDYIDARLETAREILRGEERLHQVTTDARLDKLEQGLQSLREDMNQKFDQKFAEINRTLELGFKSITEDTNTKIAALETAMHKSQSELIKWVVGAMLASTAVSISGMSLMLNIASQKNAPPAPIVIYAQPAAQK